MATTFIEYKDHKGFWIHESFMQLVFHYIYDEIKKTEYNFTNKNQLLEEIKFQIDGYSCGSVSLGWYGFVENNIEKQSMITALQNIKTYLQSLGAHISITQLQSIPTEDEDFKRLYSRKPFPVSELVKILNALIEMLKGNWNSTNYDMEIDYKY